MIHWTELREARDALRGDAFDPLVHSHTVVKALDTLLDFPTDEMVEALVRLRWLDEEAAGLVLEAVRRSMIGES